MTHMVTADWPAGSGPAAEGCWKRIGSRGDKSCSELSRHGHCRDCPSFRLAAAKLLDREIPGGAAPVAGSAAPAVEAETESSVVFRLGTEWFALPTPTLDEIVEMRRIHSLPHKRNPTLLGLVNVRGELVVCLSLASLLIGAPHSTEGRLIIIRHPGGRLACPVDEVQHTKHFASGQLQAVPATVGRSASSLTLGLFSWQGRTVARLDEQAVFVALDRSLA